jgi:hypothetical protein
VRQGLEYAREQFQDIYKLRMTLGNKKDIEEYKVENRPPPRAPAPRAAGSSKPAGPKPFKDDLAASQHWQLLADQATNPEEKAQYQAVADAARERHRGLIQDREDAKKAGAPDLSGAGLPTRPPITQSAPAPAKAPPTGTVRMKDKNGKVYNVPSGRKQEALKDGLIVAE